MQRVILVIGTLAMSTWAAGCISPEEAAAREAAYLGTDDVPLLPLPEEEPVAAPVVPMRNASGAACTTEPWEHVALDWTHDGSPRSAGTVGFDIPMDATEVRVVLREPPVGAATWSVAIDGPGSAAFSSERTEVRGDGVIVRALERGHDWSDAKGWAGDYTLAWSSHGVLFGFGVRVVAELCG